MKPNDRIFVSSSYMEDSVELFWAAANGGIASRQDQPDWDGSMVVLMDGRSVVKCEDGGNSLVLVLDPARSNGSYITVYANRRCSTRSRY